MITPTYIYWLTRCSELKSFFHGLGVLTTVVLVALTIFVIPAVANSQVGQKIPDMATELMDLATEWMKELKPVSKK